MESVKRLKRSFVFTLVLSIFLSFALSIQAQARKETSSTDLVTGEERAWLLAHPDITFVIPDDFKPFLIMSEDGSQSGVLIDLIDLLNKRLGIKIKIMVTDFASYLKMQERGEVDGVPGMSPVAAKRRNMLSTIPHFAVFPTLFARQGEFDNVNSLMDMAGKRCSIVGGFPIIEKILSPYADQVDIVRAKSTDDALRLLFEGKADFYLGVSLNTYQIAVNNFIGLAPVLSLKDHRFDAVMGVRADWPELVEILNKGLSSISETEKLAILSKWSVLPIKVPPLRTLTEEERRWLDQGHTVRARVSYWPPLMFTEPELSGMAVDYLKQISERFGFRIEFVADKSGFAAALQDLMGEKKNYDLLLSLEPTPERVTHIAFSDPYSVMPRVIYTRDDATFISSMADLNGKTVAAEKGYVTEEKLEREYPGIRLLRVASSLDALRAVATAEADAYIGNLSNATWLLREHQFDNLKIAAPAPFDNNESAMGVRKDWPELASILSKGLAAMTPAEHNVIRNRWLTTYKTEVDHWLLWQLSAVAGAVVLIILGWNRMLRRQVKKRTDELVSMNSDLIRQERLARTLLNATTDFTQLLDEDGTILALNDSIAERLGGTREELVGANIFDRFPPEVAEKRKYFIRKVLANGEPIHFEDRLRPGFVYDTEIYPIETRTGEKGQVVIFAHDITERERYEKKLREREASLNEAQRIAKLGNWSWDPDSGEVLWSQNLYEMIGLNPENPAPRFEDHVSFYTPESWAKLNQAVERTLKEGDDYNLEVTAVRTDGSQMTCVIRGEAVKDSDGQIIQLQGTVQDISDSKKAENALRESEEKFRSLVEKIPDVIWRCDSDGNTIYISKNVRDIFGFSQEEVCHLHELWRSRFHPEDIDHVSRNFSRLFETGEQFDCEYRIRHKDGHWIWLHYRSMAVYQKDGISYADGIFTDISQRKRAEQALQENRDYLEHLISSIPDAVFSVKLPERIIEWVRDSYGVLGYDLDKYVGQKTGSIYSSGAEYVKIGNLLKAAIKEKRDGFIGEAMVKTEYGESIPAEISTTIYRDKGIPKRTISLVRDISDRKQVQAALENSEARLKDAQRIAQIGNWELDIVSQTLTWSDEIFRIFEIDAKHFRASYEAFLDVIHPGDRDMVHKVYTQALKNHQSYSVDHRILMPDGRIKYVHEFCENIYSPEGKALRSVGTVQDITKRKEMEQALKESEKKLRTAQKIARLGYWEWELVSDRLFGSDETYRIYDIEPGTTLTFGSFLERIHPDDRDGHRQLAIDLLTSEKGPSFSYRILRSDGSFRYIYGMAMLELDDLGEPSRLKGTIQDVTELKTVEMAYRETENRLKKAQDETMKLRLEIAHLNRVMTMNELASSFAHEINQPLGAIVNNASAARLLKASADADEDLDEILADIAADAQRAGQIIRKIRGVMRKGDAVYAPVDVNQLLDDVLAVYQNSFRLDRVSVAVEKARDLLPVRGDLVRLQQVMVNLITNAMEAMEGSPEKSLEFETSQSGGMVKVRVKDTGPGIEEKDIDHIFDPFYTTKSEGMGIGLRICRSIIEEHDGRIWVESEPGAGTIFYFTLNVFSGG